MVRQFNRSSDLKAINPMSAQALPLYPHEVHPRARVDLGVTAMVENVEFVSAKERELRALAAEIIEEPGPEAGLRLARLARSPYLSRDSSVRLLAVAEIIGREQGHGWYFPGDEESDLI